MLLDISLRSSFNEMLMIQDMLRSFIMQSELEINVELDMIESGYNPRIWADVVEYWNEYFA